MWSVIKVTPFRPTTKLLKPLADREKTTKQARTNQVNKGKCILLIILASIYLLESITYLNSHTNPFCSRPFWGRHNMTPLPGGYSREFLVGVCRPVLQILTQSQTKQCHLYTPAAPSKTIPNSRPKWAKRIPVFRPKRRKNPTRWGGTYLYSLYKGVPPPPPGTWLNSHIELGSPVAHHVFLDWTWRLPEDEFS